MTELPPTSQTDRQRVRPAACAFTAVLTAALTLACSGASSDNDRAQKTGKAPEKTALPAVVVAPGNPDLIRYTLRFDDRQNHYINIEAIFPAGGDTVELFMAVWTPGSYLVREYARHIEAISAATPDGEPLAIDKVAKNRWRVTSGGAANIVVRYRLYARVLSVRSNFVSEDIAVLNGAPTFLDIADDRSRPFAINLELPETWTHSITALQPHGDGQKNHFTAPDFDTLVDSPIVAGTPTLHDFEVEGTPHQLANFGEDKVWDGERSARDVEALVATQIKFWGSIPYNRYIFQNVIWQGRGGLEHKDSTLMLTSRWTTRVREDYLNWLGLVSHEFFHTWNVKRLRPVELGPFDYEREVHTRALWIAEGITSYYDDLLLHRAGLMTDKEYLDKLSKLIERVETNPGSLVESLSDSSFDAWIKFYRSDENSRNSRTDYYRKGAVVGFLLDAEIRRATLDRRSLDDVMRLAYERYSGERGFTTAEFRAVATEVAGRPLDDFFIQTVDTTEKLDYGPALEHYGLRFAEKAKKGGQPRGRTDQGDAQTAAGSPDKDDKDDEEPGYLGADVRSDGTIARVIRGTPAYAAGLNVSDEILAIDDYRVHGHNLDKALKRFRPGTEVTMTVARRGKLRELPLTLGEKPGETWKLELNSAALSRTSESRRRWLAGN